MTGKQGRRLPEWYSEKVNLAAEVFSGAPNKVDTSRPHVDHKPNCGIGVTAQRISGMASTHPVKLDLDFALGGHGHGLDLDDGVAGQGSDSSE